jgi:hypothetical protein
LVFSVLIASFVLPRSSSFHSLTALGFGYGGPPAPVRYHPISPSRILDTRAASALGPGGTIDVQVSGQGGVPSTGVTAVVINATVTDTTGSSYLTIYPTLAARPTASNLNWIPGVTIANLVEVGLGTGGKLTAYNFAGSVDVVFDVQGYVSTPTGTPGTDGLYNPLPPSRVLDTRSGTGAPAAKLAGGASLTLTVAGNGGVPASGVEAVVLNLTVTNPTVPGYLTAWPTGASQPVASNLNFATGQTIPNRAIVKVNSSGQVSIFNNAGTVDVVADVSGWFTDGTSPTASGAVFTGLVPSRILDTRTSAPVAAGGMITLQVSGQGGIPATGAVAAVLNVTVTNTTGSSYLTVWPDGTGRPLASDMNWVAGQTIPNLTIVKLGSNGKVDIFNFAGSTDVVVDVMGWY